jgi:hypothetical protein
VQALPDRAEDDGAGGQRTHAVEVDAVELHDLLRRGAGQDPRNFVELVRSELAADDRAQRPGAAADGEGRVGHGRQEPGQHPIDLVPRTRDGGVAPAGRRRAYDS